MHDVEQFQTGSSIKNFQKLFLLILNVQIFNQIFKSVLK